MLRYGLNNHPIRKDSHMINGKPVHTFRDIRDVVSLTIDNEQQVPAPQI